MGDERAAVDVRQTFGGCDPPFNRQIIYSQFLLYGQISTSYNDTYHSFKHSNKMTKQRHLKNAPIIEALIDIQVKLPSNINISNIDAIHERISTQYPKKIERIKGNFIFQIANNSVPPSSDLSIIGYMCSSTDEKQIVQIRLDGFTFSRLKPYASWEDLRDEARRLWEIYTDVAKPEQITRLAVRYINRLELPLPLKFNQYLVAPPIIPPDLPQAVSSFLSRIVIPIQNTKITTVITQALEPPTSEKIVPIILDIDVFEELTKMIVEDREQNAKLIWDKLEQFRNTKNQTFFASLTEEAINLWD